MNKPELDKSKIYLLEDLNREQYLVILERLNCKFTEADLERIFSRRPNILHYSSIVSKWKISATHGGAKIFGVNALELFNNELDSLEPLKVTHEPASLKEVIKELDVPIKGDYYFYKDNFYQVLLFSESKNKISGECYNSITCTRAGSENKYTRCLEDFKTKFKKVTIDTKN